MRPSLLPPTAGLRAAAWSLLAVGTLAAQGTAPPETPRSSEVPRAGSRAAAPMRQDLEELATALGRAHGLAADAKPITSFGADLRVESRDKQEKDSISIDIRVDFSAPRSLRCQVREKGVRVERGMDPELGPWAISGDRVLKLQGADFARDADQIAHDLRLCRQIVRFLDPQRMLRTLEDPGPVGKEDLEITKRLTFHACPTVEGVLTRFPIYTVDADGRARVKLFVHPDTSQLLAVRAQPIGDDGKPTQPTAELILLGDYAETQGLHLPSKLTVFRVDGDAREPLQTVHINGIELDREFAPKHFARPKQ
ncbi:MAG: hypothetical protein R3F56_18365 [Planctomycetota bacterium]